MLKARITGLGSYLPERVLTNQHFEKIVDTSHEWIVSRTGISERRQAHGEEAASDMGFIAGSRALQEAKISPTDVDLILVSTMTPDYISPSTAALIQHRLGANRAGAFDLQAACTGFIYALATAKAYVESGLYRQVLVIASEKMSAYMDYTDRNTCVLFGDGAAAAVVAAEGEGLKIDHICLGADGELAPLIMVQGGGSRHPASQETLDQGMHFFKMAGKEVFKHAVRRMGSAAKECLDRAGISDQQISWLVPHQANIRIMDALSKNFNLPDERVYKTIHKYGNTSGSGVGIALDELMKEKTVQPGEHLLLVAFGAGLTWGATLLTKL